MTVVLALLSITLFQNATGLTLEDVPEGMLSTPHGIRPKQCVHQVKDNNHIIRHLSGGVQVEYPGLGTTEFYPELSECVDNMKQLKKLQTDKNLQNGGWEIDGGYYTKNSMGNFSSTYVVPNEDPSNEGQILYYFIGLQDNGENNLTIIQPVVAWCPNGCGYSYDKGWTMASWNCCPSGETWYGSGVQLSKGVTVNAYTYSTGSDAYVYESYNGKASVLNIKSDYRVFNWACVTGEFYNYKDCNAFNQQPFYFRNMKITDIKNSVETPNWQINNNIKNCGASLTVSGDTATMIGKS